MADRPDTRGLEGEALAHKPFDDAQSAYLTHRATAFDNTLLFIRQKPGGSFSRLRRVQVLTAETEPSRAISVGY